MSATALLLASAVIGGIGAIQQGQAAKQAGDLQAAVLRQQADRERLQAASKEEDFRRARSRDAAFRRAGLGGSGVVQGEGSPLLVMAMFLHADP